MAAGYSSPRSAQQQSASSTNSSSSHEAQAPTTRPVTPVACDLRIDNELGRADLLLSPALPLSPPAHILKRLTPLKRQASHSPVSQNSENSPPSSRVGTSGYNSSQGGRRFRKRLLSASEVLRKVEDLKVSNGLEIERKKTELEQKMLNAQKMREDVIKDKKERASKFLNNRKIWGDFKPEDEGHLTFESVDNLQDDMPSSQDEDDFSLQGPCSNSVTSNEPPEKKPPLPLNFKSPSSSNPASGINPLEFKNDKPTITIFGKAYKKQDLTKHAIIIQRAIAKHQTKRVIRRIDRLNIFGKFGMPFEFISKDMSDSEVFKNISRSSLRKAVRLILQQLKVPHNNGMKDNVENIFLSALIVVWERAHLQKNFIQRNRHGLSDSTLGSNAKEAYLSYNLPNFLESHYYDDNFSCHLFELLSKHADAMISTFRAILKYGKIPSDFSPLRLRFVKSYRSFFELFQLNRDDHAKRCLLILLKVNDSIESSFEINNHTLNTSSSTDYATIYKVQEVRSILRKQKLEIKKQMKIFKWFATKYETNFNSKSMHWVSLGLTLKERRLVLYEEFIDLDTLSVSNLVKNPKILNSVPLFFTDKQWAQYQLLTLLDNYDSTHKPPLTSIRRTVPLKLTSGRLTQRHRVGCVNRCVKHLSRWDLYLDLRGNIGTGIVSEKLGIRTMKDDIEEFVIEYSVIGMEACFKKHMDKIVSEFLSIINRFCLKNNTHDFYDKYAARKLHAFINRSEGQPSKDFFNKWFSLVVQCLFIMFKRFISGYCDHVEDIGHLIIKRTAEEKRLEHVHFLCLKLFLIRHKPFLSQHWVESQRLWERKHKNIEDVSQSLLLWFNVFIDFADSQVSDSLDLLTIIDEPNKPNSTYQQCAMYNYLQNLPGIYRSYPTEVLCFRLELRYYQKLTIHPFPKPDFVTQQQAGYKQQVTEYILKVIFHHIQDAGDLGRFESGHFELFKDQFQEYLDHYRIIVQVLFIQYTINNYFTHAPLITTGYERIKCFSSHGYSTTTPTKNLIRPSPLLLIVKLYEYFKKHGVGSKFKLNQDACKDILEIIKGLVKNKIEEDSVLRRLFEDFEDDDVKHESLFSEFIDNNTIYSSLNGLLRNHKYLKKYGQRLHQVVFKNVGYEMNCTNKDSIEKVFKGILGFKITSLIYKLKRSIDVNIEIYGSFYEKVCSVTSK